jgi:hypothetical protein
VKRNLNSILLGIALIVLGGWLLAGQLGLSLPGLAQLWPGLIMLAGLGALLNFIAGRNTDELFLGVAALLTGGFFFLFTLGRLSWRADMPRAWPAFLIIFSLASAAEWLAAPAHRAYLVRAGLALLIGLFFFAYYFNLFGDVLMRQVLQFWPVLLIVAGLIAVARSLRQAH